MKITVFTLLSSLLLTSCAFNSRFHHSEKIDLPITALRGFDHGKDTTSFIYDEKTRLIKLLDSKGNDKNEGLSITNMFFESTSGNRLNGWHMKPKDKAPLAMILHFHGGAANLFSQYQSIKPLVSLGYEVFTFDYSGYGFSEGKSTRKAALLDAYSALDYVSKGLNPPSAKLIIYGHSYGGYLASIVGSKQQSKIDGIVLEGAFSSHKEEAKFTTPFWGNLVRNGPIAAQEIKQLRQPLLVIHSIEDKAVPFTFGKEIFESANDAKFFFKIEGRHILGLQLYSDAVSDKIKRLMLD